VDMTEDLDGVGGALWGGKERSGVRRSERPVMSTITCHVT
jgi:hypothetical protein